jgi:hypothetical protein
VLSSPLPLQSLGVRPPCRMLLLLLQPSWRACCQHCLAGRDQQQQQQQQQRHQ